MKTRNFDWKFSQNGGLESKNKHIGLNGKGDGGRKGSGVLRSSGGQRAVNE